MKNMISRRNFLAAAGVVAAAQLPLLPLPVLPQLQLPATPSRSALWAP